MSAGRLKGNWVITAPWAHPLWHSYILHLIHLRPMGDGRKTLFYVPGATHEMMLFALDPEYPLEPIVMGQARAQWLRPGNFAAQFISPSDEMARRRIRDTVSLICAAGLNPDTDAISQWVALYGDAMVKK